MMVVGESDALRDGCTMKRVVACRRSLQRRQERISFSGVLVAKRRVLGSYLGGQEGREKEITKKKDSKAGREETSGLRRALQV